MAMRAVWSGTWEIGLLNVSEVFLVNAIESGEKVSFRQLHRDCSCRVQQKLFCPTCQKDIIDKTAEIVKGYENGKDNYRDTHGAGDRILQEGIHGKPQEPPVRQP